MVVLNKTQNNDRIGIMLEKRFYNVYYESSSYVYECLKEELKNKKQKDS